MRRRTSAAAVALGLLALSGCVPALPHPSPVPPPPAWEPPPAARLLLAAVEVAAEESSRASTARALEEGSRRVGGAATDATPLPPWACTPAEREALRGLDDEARAEAQTASDAAALEEWRRSPWTRRRGGSGLAYYRRMRWMYLRRGVCHPDRLFEEGIVITRFFGRTLEVHATVAPRLERVEAAWRQQGGRASPITRAGGFKARTVRGPYGTLPWLSNHAFGLAIDIDPPRNPYVPLRDLELIAAISGLPTQREATIPPGERWDRWRQAEAAFRANIRPWLQANAATIHRLRREARAGDAPALLALRDAEALRRRVTSSAYLRLLARGGSLLHMPRALVVAMEEAGFTWCTDFTNGADLMHFEIR